MLNKNYSSFSKFLNMIVIFQLFSYRVSIQNAIQRDSHESLKCETDFHSQKLSKFKGINFTLNNFL